MNRRYNFILLLLVFASFFNGQILANTIKLGEINSKFISPNFLYQKTDSIKIAKQYNEIKKLYDEKKYVNALAKALKYYEHIKNNNELGLEQISSFTILIGDIFNRTNDYKKSLNYYKKSLSFYNVLKDDNKNVLYSNPLYARSLFKIGAMFQKMSVKDSAIFYYDKLEELNSLNDEILDIKAASYTNLSGIYQQELLYSKAEALAKNAIAIHKKRNDQIKQSSGLNNLANIYLREKSFEKAKGIYFKAIDLIDKDSSANATRIKASLYFNLAWAMRNLKDYKAYDFQELSYDIKDNIKDVEISTMIEQVNAIHNVDVAKKLARKEAQNVTWIIGISSFFIIVLLVFFLNQYKLRQKNLGLELSKKDLLQQQRLEKVKNESQVRILNATLDGKETERKQIAETLHDSVSALLSSANLHLQACKTQFNGTTPIEVDKSQSIINEASQKIRDLSHTLVSSILLKFGLSYAIKDIAEKFSNSQLQIDYETKYIRRYDQNFEIKLYNITQEFVNNILKHSSANQARITLVEKNKKLQLTIQDNGVGFDKTIIPEKDGLGLNQITARIQVMQGKFTIDSEKDKGTKIEIELPVFEKELAKIS